MSGGPNKQSFTETPIFPVGFILFNTVCAEYCDPAHQNWQTTAGGGTEIPAFQIISDLKSRNAAGVDIATEEVGEVVVSYV